MFIGSIRRNILNYFFWTLAFGTRWKYLCIHKNNSIFWIFDNYNIFLILIHIFFGYIPFDYSFYIKLFFVLLFDNYKIQKFSRKNFEFQLCTIYTFLLRDYFFIIFFYKNFFAFFLLFYIFHFFMSDEIKNCINNFLILVAVVY